MADPFSEKKRIPWNLAPQYWTRQEALFNKNEWLDHPLMATGDVREVYEETGRGMDALL